MLCPALGRVEREGARVREAVEHPAALRELGRGQTVVFLVEEEAGLLPVLHVDRVVDPVFADLGDGACGRRLPGEGIPALVLLESLECPDGDVVALKDAVDLLTVCAQNLHNQRKNQIFDALHPHRKGLRDQKIGETIHREPREAVGLAEDHAAAAEVLRPQHGLAVVPGVLHAPPPEGRVEAVVGVAGDEAQADLALAAVKARADVFAALAECVAERAVFRLRALVEDLRGVDPGVALIRPALALAADGEKGIVPRLLHAAPPCRSE